MTKVNYGSISRIVSAKSMPCKLSQDIDTIVKICYSVFIMENHNYDRLSSPTNPNGVFGEFIDGSLKEQFPEKKDRLTVAIADIKSFLVESVGVDPDMAEVVAARAAQEITSALDSDLTQDEVNRAIEVGSELSSTIAVDRAVDNILSQQ